MTKRDISMNTRARPPSISRPFSKWLRNKSMILLPPSLQTIRMMIMSFWPKNICLLFSGKTASKNSKESSKAYQTKKTTRKTKVQLWPTKLGLLILWLLVYLRSMKPIVIKQIMWFSSRTVVMSVVVRSRSMVLKSRRILTFKWIRVTLGDSHNFMN